MKHLTKWKVGRVTKYIMVSIYFTLTKQPWDWSKVKAILVFRCLSYFNFLKIYSLLYCIPTTVCPPFLPQVFIPISSFPASHLPSASHQKRADLPGMSTKHNTTSYNKPRLIALHQGWTKKSKRMKRVPQVGKSLRQSLLPLLEITQEHQST